MKLDAKHLGEIFKRFDGVTTEAIFDFGEEGLSIIARSPTNIAMLKLTVPKTSFKDYEAIGKIGVQDIQVLKNITTRFGADTELKVEGNLLTIKEKGKKVECELVNIEFIDEIKAIPALELDETFTIKSDDIKNFIGDVNVNKEITYTITTVEKMVRLENTGKFKFRQDIPADCKGGVSVKFSEDFAILTNNLSGDLSLSLKSDYPMQIVEKNDVMKTIYIIAPRVEPKEE